MMVGSVQKKAGYLAVAMLAFGCSFVGQAQMNNAAAPKIAPGTMVEPAKSFDGMLTSFEKEMVGAAQAMPAEKYNFAPTAGEFKGVRTFGEEVTHVAEANYYYGNMVGGLKVDTDTDALTKLKDKDQIIAALKASFVFAHKAIANLTPKNAFESVHETQTRASLAGGLVAHGFDHYGQMVEYLRMNGIVPPASAK